VLGSLGHISGSGVGVHAALTGFGVSVGVGRGVTVGSSWKYTKVGSTTSKGDEIGGAEKTTAFLGGESDAERIGWNAHQPSQPASRIRARNISHGYGFVREGVGGSCIAPPPA
jgi:hypothetical protein